MRESLTLTMQGAAADRGREPLAGRDRHDGRGGRPARAAASGRPGGCGRRCCGGGADGARPRQPGPGLAPAAARRRPGRGSSSSPGRSTAGTTTRHLAEVLAEDEGIAIGRSTLRRLLRARGCASPRTGAGRPGTGAGASGWPRRACSSRSTAAGTTGSRAGGPGSPWWAGSTTRPGSSSAAVFREQEDGVGYLDHAARHGPPARPAGRPVPGRLARSSPPRRRAAAGRDEATQVGRALAELGIATILAGSAQAKGRIERAWGTLQDRLVSELRRAGAADLRGRERGAARLPAPLQPPVRGPAGERRPGLASGPRRSRPRAGLRLPLAARPSASTAGPARGVVLQLPPGPGGRSLAGRRVEVELRLDGRLLVVADGRLLAAVPAPPEPRRLREVRVLAPGGPPPEPTSRNVGLSSRGGPSVEAPLPRAARGATDRIH